MWTGREKASPHLSLPAASGSVAGRNDRFSKRRVQIEADQAERGGEGARDAEGAALRTRQARQTAPDGENVHTRWSGEAAAAGYDAGRIVADAAPRRLNRPRGSARLPDEYAGHTPVSRLQTAGTADSAPRQLDGDAGADARLVDWLLGPGG